MLCLDVALRSTRIGNSWRIMRTCRSSIVVIRIVVIIIIILVNTRIYVASAWTIERLPLVKFGRGDRGHLVSNALARVENEGFQGLIDTFEGADREKSNAVHTTDRIANGKICRGEVFSGYPCLIANN